MAEQVNLLLMANFADRIGGGEESLLTLARGLDRHRFALHAVVPGDGEIAEVLRSLEIPVAVLPLPPVRPWSAAAGLRTIRRFRSTLVAWGIGLVHAHGSRGALYAGLAARKLKIPMIWHVRIADRDRILDGALLSLSTRAIAISKAVAARFDGSRRAWKVRVVYNGVDPGYWQPTGPFPPPRPGPVVLLVGQLSPGKGQATLLRAAPAVLQRLPATRFILLGRDLDREADRLRELSRGLAVNGALEFREWMADPRPTFQEADVVVLPSRSEGFGRVLVEAACLGKPVIASRVGGIPEVVLDGETGILMPPDDPPALAEALLKLLGNPALRARMGAAARKRAMTCFTARQHVEGIEAVYTELLGT